MTGSEISQIGDFRKDWIGPETPDRPGSEISETSDWGFPKDQIGPDRGFPKGRIGDFLTTMTSPTKPLKGPFNHLYQACSGPGLIEVPVDTFQLSGSRKICISFGNLEDENGKTES